MACGIGKLAMLSTHYNTALGVCDNATTQNKAEFCHILIKYIMAHFLLGDIQEVIRKRYNE